MKSRSHSGFGGIVGKGGKSGGSSERCARLISEEHSAGCETDRKPLRPTETHGGSKSVTRTRRGKDVHVTEQSAA